MLVCAVSRGAEKTRAGRVGGGGPVALLTEKDEEETPGEDQGVPKTVTVLVGDRTLTGQRGKAGDVGGEQVTRSVE